MLLERFPSDFVADAVAGAMASAPVGRSPFPPAADRAAWERVLQCPLNRRRMDRMIAKSDELLGRAQPILPVSGSFEFVRSGDRAKYEGAYFARRRDLAIHVLAVCFSPDSRRIEAAVDIAWAICEETIWALPAHAERRTPGDPLPDIRRPSLDIFACETAAVLAEMLHLLGAELAALSPVIAERIEGEIAQRIIEPFEQRDDFWWLSGENNWNPWCVSATLLAASHVIREPDRLSRIAQRSMAALDRFIARYPADGCCDEGAMYWAASLGALLIGLEALHEISGGKISIFDEPKIIAMAQYIVHVHLGGGYCFNYSDCPPRLGNIAARVYRLGARIGDDSLKDLAMLAARGWSSDGEPDDSLGIGSIASGGSCGALMQALRILFWLPADACEPLSSDPRSPVPLGHWYPEMQVLVARSAPEFSPPMVLGFKGGTNGVNHNHNHNDIGSFVIQSSGSPVIVDVGNNAYTRQTFGSERYSMWWNASRGHNVLQFGEHGQAAGAEFRAELVGPDMGHPGHAIAEEHGQDARATMAGGVDGIAHADSAKLAFELAGAYPPEAGVLSWQRSCLLRRGDSPQVTVSDSFRLSSPMEVKFPLFTPCGFALEEGKAILKTSAGRRVAMTWDPEKLDVLSAPLESDEPFLDAAWGTTLRRLICRIPGKVEQAEYQFSFEPIP
jgi:hypothetical protein